MKRGEIRNVSRGSVAGRSRPVVILQDDAFDAANTTTICAFGSDETDAPLFRLLIEPTPRNGLRSASRLMVDKVTTVAKERIGAPIGRLDDRDIVRLNQALMVFLGLARPVRTSRRKPT